MIIGLDVLQLAGSPLPFGIIIIIPGKLSESVPGGGGARMFVGGFCPTASPPAGRPGPWALAFLSLVYEKSAHLIVTLSLCSRQGGGY